MAALSSARKKWLGAALAFAGLGLAGFMLRPPLMDWLEGRRICEQLRTAEGHLELFSFTDTMRPRSGPRLGPGTYRMTVTSDCYSGECTFVVLELPERSYKPHHSGIQCRGQGLHILTKGWHIDGFQAPRVLDPRRMLVKIRRDGRLFWHGTIGNYCPQRGFCVETIVPRE